MTKKYELAVFIGRFEPFHNGHLDAARKALKIADRLLFIIGSANLAKSSKNPFRAAERRLMIEDSLHGEPILFEYVGDQPEEDWVSEVQTKIGKHQEQDRKICIVGHDKDASTYYLRGLFPQWKFEDMGETPVVVNNKPIDATRVRELMFTGNWSFVSGAVPPAVFSRLQSWAKTEDFKNLAEEFEYYAKYKKAWANSPHEPKHITTDAVVVQSGHILMIERGEAPGKGLLALPGGFLAEGVYIKDNAIKELKEETSIKLQEEILNRCIVAHEYFDNPFRSQRGRVVTHAFLFQLDDTKPLPPVRGADDAKEAMWLPFNEVLNHPEDLFEDHHQIITVMLRKLRSKSY